MAKGTSDLGTDPFDLKLKNRPGSYEDVTLYTGTRYDRTQWRIERQGPNQTNYWVLPVPKQIISGHGPIFEGGSRADGGAFSGSRPRQTRAARSVPLTVQGSSAKVRWKRRSNVSGTCRRPGNDRDVSATERRRRRETE